MKRTRKPALAFPPLHWIVFSFLAFLFSLSSLGVHGETNREIRNAVYYYKRAQEAHKIKDYRQAIGFYRQALESNPRHVPSYLGAAKAYAILSIYTQAERAYRSILEYLPRHQEARIGLAQVLIKTGKMPQAYAILSAVQKEDSSSPENNYSLGLWHLREGNSGQAQRYFKRTLSLDPSHISALIETAQLLIHLKRPEQAELYIERAAAVNPSHPRLYQIRGHLNLSFALSKRESQGRSDLMESAYKSFLNAKKLAPQDMKINQQLIYLDIYRKRFDAAKSLLAELGTELTNDPKYYYLSALLKLEGLKKKQGGLGPVIQDLSRALELDPENSYIRHSFENTALDYRHLPGAAAVCKKLAAYHLKELRYQRKKYRHDRMQSHLNRILDLDPLSPKSLKIRLNILKTKQDYEGLLAVYQKILGQRPNDFKLRQRIDRALRERKRNIAYREKLFNPVLSTEKASFERSSRRIFTFSIKSQNFLADYPDLSEQIGRAINTELNQAGPLQGMKESARRAILKYIGAIDSHSHSPSLWGLPYQSRHINYLHQALREERKKIDYLISGEYRNTPSGVLHAIIQLRESNTGTSIAQFSFKTRARNSILDLALQLREAILKRIPVEGKIIKTEGKKLFINLGSYDGVKRKSRLAIPSLSLKKSALQVEEVGAYVSRVSPLKNFQKQKFQRGIKLRLLKAKK